MGVGATYVLFRSSATNASFRLNDRLVLGREAPAGLTLTAHAIQTISMCDQNLARFDEVLRDVDAIVAASARGSALDEARRWRKEEEEEGTIFQVAKTYLEEERAITAKLMRSYAETTAVCETKCDPEWWRDQGVLVVDGGEAAWKKQPPRDINSKAL